MASRDRDEPSKRPQGAVVDWSSRPVDELLDHIVNDRHAELHRALPSLRSNSERAAAAGRRAAADLSMVRQVIEDLESDLSLVLYQEARVLFPAVRAGGLGPIDADLAGTIAMVRDHHQNLLGSLSLLRRVTNLYTAPDGAGDAVRELYAAAAALDDALKGLIRLEENVLFPRLLAAGKGPTG